MIVATTAHEEDCFAGEGKEGSGNGKIPNSNKRLCQWLCGGSTRIPRKAGEASVHEDSGSSDQDDPVSSQVREGSDNASVGLNGEANVDDASTSQDNKGAPTPSLDTSVGSDDDEGSEHDESNAGGASTSQDNNGASILPLDKNEGSVDGGLNVDEASIPLQYKNTGSDGDEGSDHGGGNAGGASTPHQNNNAGFNGDGNHTWL